MATLLTNISEQQESTGLLSITTGQLKIARLPVDHAPDWIVPQDLILDIIPKTELVWNYHWKNQDIPVHRLVNADATPHAIVILESITDVHRIGLQVANELEYYSVRISDLKDAEPMDYEQALASYRHDNIGNPATDQASLSIEKLKQQQYIFEPVILQGEVCVIPDLDKLSHFLVDLDS